MFQEVKSGGWCFLEPQAKCIAAKKVGPEKKSRQESKQVLLFVYNPILALNMSTSEPIKVEEVKAEVKAEDTPISVEVPSSDLSPKEACVTQSTSCSFQWLIHLKLTSYPSFH